MKITVSLIRSVIRLIGCRILPVAVMGMLVLGISLGHAQTLTDAEASIYTQVECGTPEPLNNFNPVGDVNNFNIQCGPVVSYLGTNRTTYNASGNITLKFTEPSADGFPILGKIAGLASSSMDGYNRNFARAHIQGDLKYYFKVVQVGSPPGTLSTVPVKITARAEGSVEMGRGAFGASVFVGNYAGFPPDLFKLEWTGGPHSASFDQSLTLHLLTNTQYQAHLSANANAYCPSVTELSVNDDVCVASVFLDPSIRFDQEAFDSTYGANSFRLSDYYSLEFSPNMDVTPPPAEPEQQATFGIAEQTTPTLGNDSIGDYVVFTSYMPTGTGAAQSDIYYQRLVNGQPSGIRVPVAVTALDERLNDCNGDYIVYTRFESVTTTGGKIMLYQISTGQTRELDSEPACFFPKIYGDVVVWLKMTANGNLLLMYRISWGTPVVPIMLAIPMPNPKDIEVGDRFVVWGQIANGQYDVVAYDIQNNTYVSIASNPNLHERDPSTSGPWVAYQVSATGTPSVIAIHARNPDTDETRIIADNGAASYGPNIDGNLISYESNITGNWDVYVYRIAQGDTLQVTSRPDDQRLNDVHGNLVAYVDARNGNLDVFVSTLVFTVNHPPILDHVGDKAVDEEQLLEFVVTATDPDGNTLTYSASDLPLGAAFDPATQTFTWTPGYAQAGVFNVLFNVTDNGMPPMSATETIAIVVGNVNRPPVLDPIGNKAVNENSRLEFFVTGSDPDQDLLAFSASNLPAGATFSADTGSFSWVPDYTQSGNYNVLFKVTDSGTPPASKEETVTITVGNVNRPPVMDPIGNRAVAEGQLLTFPITGSDPDGDALEYSVGSMPAGATFNATTQTFTWTPTYEQAGNHPVRFTVTDNGTPRESGTEEINISVGNVNRPPVLGTIGSKTIAEGQTLTFVVTGTDPDGDAVTYTTGELPAGATFNSTTQTFTWTPTYEQAGSYQNIEFTVTDNGTPNELDVEIIEITVGNSNRAPMFTPIGAQSTLENQPLRFTVGATDPDGDVIAYSTGPLPMGASFDVSTRSFSWTPGGTQAGNYTVAFYATDSGGLVGQLEVVISVGETSTPLEMANQIIQTVISLNLRKAVENSYMANLKKVPKFIQDGKIFQAIIQLDVFIVKVLIDMAQGDISYEAGRNLTSMAIDLINTIRR